MSSVVATRSAKSQIASVSVTRISSWTEWPKLRSHWELLANTSAPEQFFVSWDFVSSWWQANGQRRELFVLLCHNEQGTLIGIAPLYRESSKAAIGRELRTLRLIGDGSDDADGFGLLVSRGAEEQGVKAILQWLKQNGKEWDLLELNSMAENSTATQALLDQTGRREWVRRSAFSSHLMIELPSSWEEFLQTLSAKVRQTWLRKIRRIEQDHHAHLRQTLSLSELEADLATAFVLHNKSWQVKGTSGKLESEARQDFYRLLCPAALKRGELDLCLLEIDGVPRAARLGFRSGKTRYAVLAGMDPEFAHLSLGTVVEALALKRCIERGDKVYDFLAGEEAYKLECAPVRRRYVSMLVARPRTRAGVRLSAAASIENGKKWIRNGFPATYSVLRRATRLRNANPPKAMVQGPELRLEVIRERSEFAALYKDWKLLSPNTGDHSIFLDWEWMSSWLDAYGDRRLHVLAAFDSSECVGIAPLYLSQWPSARARSLRVLRLIGDETGDSGQLGFLVPSGRERDFVEAALDWLDAHRSDWDALELQSLAHNTSVAALVDDIGRRSWAARERKSLHMVIDLPDSVEKFQANLSRGLAKSLAASKKQLASQEIRFHRCQSSREVDAGLEQLFHLHTLRWKRQGGLGAFADPRRREFYRTIATSMNKRDQLDLWTMSIDGKTVAAEFGLRKTHSRVSMQSGFDPDFAGSRVGSLLDEEIIKKSIERGIRSYDLMEGEQEYKRRWGARPQEFTFVRCAPPGTIGAAWVKISGSKTAQKLWQRFKLKKEVTSAPC